MKGSIIAFIISLTQLGIIALSYVKQWSELFALAFYHLSPIMVFLGVLSKIGLFTGFASHVLWFGVAFCLVKYTIFIRAMIQEDPNWFKMLAGIAEVVMIAGSTLYIVRYAY